jgi:hypothetical protein
MNSWTTSQLTVVLFAAACLSACETLPHDAFRLSETALDTRRMQTREYSSIDDTAILSASMAVDATNMLEAVGTMAVDTMQCVVTLMLACTRKRYGEIDDVQDIRLTLISRPQAENRQNVAVRVTMQRVIWDKEGRVSEQETIIDRQVYSAFFQKLSTAVFLEQAGL